MDETYSIFISAFILSLCLAKDLDADEQNLLGSYLQIIGQNLTSISAFISFFDNDNCNLTSDKNPDTKTTKN